MPDKSWTITLRIHRQKAGHPPRFQEFSLEAAPEEYILDAIERVWAFHDRSLTFNHACHHSVCGACGMRLNGLEKLTCITRVGEITRNGGVVLVQPLRNFPVVSDLVVDMGALYARMEGLHAEQVLPLEQAPLTVGPAPARDEARDADLQRLVDCVECGLCVSACPVAATSEAYLGPAALAAAQQVGIGRAPEARRAVDSARGVWRCHSAYACSAVCPSNVEPARRIMDLRKQVALHRFKSLARKRA